MTLTLPEEEAEAAIAHPLVQSLFASISDGVLAIDAQSRRVLTMNPVAKALLGYGDDDVVGCQCKNVMKSPACTWSCPLSALLKGEDDASRLDLFYRGAHDDALVHAHTRMILIRNPAGKALVGIEIFKDLTEVRALKKALGQRRQLGGMLGQSPAMQRLYALVEEIAPYDIPVLVTGASGVGKERCADAIHAHSRRADKPLITLNCAALSPQLVESELFGHKRGAFTGAHQARKGAFETADGGTLFLDEVGELPLGIQAKLLRVLQEGEVKPLGAEGVKRVDIRLITATNRALDEMVAEGRFRADLYYRLLGAQVEIPPLAERLEDIPLLAAHFLARFRAEPGGGALPTCLSTGAMAALMAHPWPGNIRELEHRLRLAAIRSAGQEEIAAQHLQFTAKPDVAQAQTFALATLERLTIKKALKHVDGNLTAAARLLEIDRSTLWRKLKKFDLD